MARQFPQITGTILKVSELRFLPFLSAMASSQSYPSLWLVSSMEAANISVLSITQPGSSTVHDTYWELSICWMND